RSGTIPGRGDDPSRTAALAAHRHDGDGDGSGDVAVGFRLWGWIADAAAAGDYSYWRPAQFHGSFSGVHARDSLSIAAPPGSHFRLENMDQIRVEVPFWDGPPYPRHFA